MRKLTTLITVMLLAFCFSFQADAQFRFGLKAGINVSKLSFNESTLDSDNRTGFTGGLMTEFTVPLIGIGADLSALYVHRNENRDYIEIPLNLKYKLTLPVVSHIVKPFITTGPSVAFLTSKKAIDEAWTNNSVDWAWNFGLGVELIRKVQIAASYGLGLTNTLHSIGKIENKSTIEGKNRYWTITAAYLF